jgi:hypothetical protein
LKTALIIFITALGLGLFAGCEAPVAETEPISVEKEPLSVEKEPLTEQKKFFTVDFQQGKTLRYKFESSRDIKLEWDPMNTASKDGKDKIETFTESMEMVISYEAIKVDTYGLTTIKATCESVKARRSPKKERRNDAVQSLARKSFTFTIGPTGKIEDYSNLKELIKSAGDKAFRPKSTHGRIKEPDMIDDFVTTQWFLWDSVSSIKKAVEGVSLGQSWKSQLLVPTSMVLRKARDVTYTFKEVRQTEKGQLAVIQSSFSPSKSVPRGWPTLYSGSFQLSGPFGFLRMFVKGFKVASLKGRGEELFNIDAGRIEQYEQNYQMQLLSTSKSVLGTKPRITIKQKLTMQLLGGKRKGTGKAKKK